MGTPEKVKKKKPKIRMGAIRRSLQAHLKIIKKLSKHEIN
jgi:hypothetical protein